MLGPLEAEVMKIIWFRGPALVSEVEEILNRRRSVPLAYKTVLTICTRLGEKGILGHDKEGRAFRFHPTMTESEFVAVQASKATAALLSRFGDVALYDLCRPGRRRSRQISRAAPPAVRGRARLIAERALGYFGPMNRSMAPWSSKNTVISSILSAALKRTTVR